MGTTKDSKEEGEKRQEEKDGRIRKTALALLSQNKSLSSDLGTVTEYFRYYRECIHIY